MVNMNTGDQSKADSASYLPLPTPQPVGHMHQTYLSECMQCFLDQLPLGKKKICDEKIRLRNLDREE
jgi:hypothetical protein